MTSGDDTHLDFLIGSPTKTYPAGRVCAHHGCTTPLSKYNPEDYCAAHLRLHDDDPERMDYGGHIFCHCPVCDRVYSIKRFVQSKHMCRRCAG